MTEANTVPAKYIFLDVVEYTKNRSVEAQTEIIDELNALVETAVKESGISKDNVIYLPTGDGLCIAMLDTKDPYDVEIRIGLHILSLIEEHNRALNDETRRFKVRVGINENVDNLVTDINGKKNVAGLGINMAQRVMSQADGGQILVGNTVFERLKARDKYMGKFRSYSAKVKHGEAIPVHQYVDSAHSHGLNREVPSVFYVAPRKSVRLTKLMAYYFAHALKLEKFLKHAAKKDELYNVGCVILWYLARDSLEISQCSDYKLPLLKTYKDGKAPVEEMFVHYRSLPYWITRDLSACIEKDLWQYSKCFEAEPWEEAGWCLINDEGKDKLNREFPSICKEFGLGE